MTREELEQIYNDAYKAVYWTAMSLLKNEADAEDIVQDSFIAFIESYPDIKDTTKATALLKKIAANKCLDRIKLAKTDTVDEEFFEDVEAVPEDFLPDSIVESEDARRIIMDIIENSLSEDIRRTLILFYFDEMSTREIAEALGVPEGTVRRRLNFARNKIKKEVEKYEKDNKTKLFGMALPFLSKLFMKEAEQVPFKAMPAKLISLSASAQASHAGAATKIAASAAKKGTGIMINKYVVGGIASAVAVGVTAVIVLNIVNKPGRPPETAESTVNSENEEVKDTSVNTGRSTSRTTDGKGYYDDDDEAYYYVQDMTPEEIADLCVYYYDSAHKCPADNVGEFEQYLLVKPYKFKIDDDHDSAYAYYSSYVRDGIDHISYMDISGFDLKNEIDLGIDVIVLDKDRAVAIVEAIKDHYAAAGAEYKDYDSKMYDGGYKIELEDKQTLYLSYSELEFDGITYYEIRFSVT